MAKHEWGSVRRGNDDDGAPAANERKVQIENSYFEKLNERLGVGTKPGPPPITVEPRKPVGPGYVVYGDDGRPIT